MISFGPRALLSSALFLGLGLCCTTNGLAQSSAGLQGRATDAAGRPIQNAVVQIVSDQTAHTGRAWRYTLIGDSLGKFSQEGLAPGAYLVMLFTDGKATEVLRRVQLKSGGVQAVDLTLGSRVEIAGTGRTLMDGKRRVSTLMR